MKFLKIKRYTKLHRQKLLLISFKNSSLYGKTPLTSMVYVLNNRSSDRNHLFFASKT